MSDFTERLLTYLDGSGLSNDFEQLTPDASTREYFRIGYHGRSAVVCLYPEPFDRREQSYLDVTSLFQRNGLPVARVLDLSEPLGLIVLEDLGDRILREELLISTPDHRNELIDKAIRLIPRIQAATRDAFGSGSIASKLKFDAEKLGWELDFFKTHYFETFKKQPLDTETNKGLTNEFAEIANELETRAAVLCHRDFHAANLMIDANDDLFIIDHQDARIGSVTYDLVSLLLDRLIEPPSAEWLAEKRQYFLSEREKLGLECIDETDLADEFRLQTIQRCLKAVGTFSYQSANRGKTYFVPFIRPMFQIVLRAAENVKRFPILSKTITHELA